MQVAGKKLTIKQIIALVCTALFIIGVIYLKTREYALPTAQVQLGGQTLTLEIADSPITRTRGLGRRAELSENHGMLFLFLRPDRYAFWMKEMKFPIDIIWLNAGAIVDMAPDVPVPISEDLPTYMPRMNATSAVEVRAGFIRRWGLKIGDRVKLLTK